MDESYLITATKYVEMNPVRARLVTDPYAWQWSSATAHASGKDDPLVKVAPLLEMVGDWRMFLEEASEEGANKIRRHERTGRALGSESFLDTLESNLQRVVKPQKAGRKKLPEK